MVVNQQTLEGNWKQIKGKIRERWGDLSGDQLESAHGNIEQLVGTIQEQTGEARASVEKFLEELTINGSTKLEDASETARQYAHAAQESIQAVAQQASEVVKEKYAQTEEVVQKRPLESLAVCFGTGLITGVVVGLMLRSR